MSIKTKAYAVLKSIKDQNTQKQTFADGDKIIVCESGCFTVDSGALNTELQGYKFVTNLAVIAESDYSKIVAYLGNPPKDKLKSMTSLQWIQLPSAGLNGYDKLELYAQVPTITNAKGVFSVPIAEYVISTMCFSSKFALNYTLGRDFARTEDKELANSVALIVGVGNIGEEIAKRTKVLCKRTIGVDAFVDREFTNVDELYPVTELEQCLPQADFVISVLPESEETNNTFCEKTFSLMKDGVVFINVGRGNSVNQEDLLKTLNSGKVGRACLDVSVPDPLPPTHPLRKNKKVLLTGHRSFNSLENANRLNTLATENLKCFLKGEELKNKVKL